MRNFLVSHLTQIATYATIIVIFTHNVLFDREMACTCQGQPCGCVLYILLPIGIIFLLLLWKDKNFNGTCRAYCCMKTRSQEKFSYHLFIQVVKAIVIGLLWFVSVLFDGDWVACCWNGLPEEKAQIPCKTSRTLDEQAKIDDVKNWSKNAGLVALLILLLLVVCFSLLKWYNREWLSYSDGDEPYELIIIQEEENVVNQILKERAKETLKQKVQEILEKDKMNTNCYDAAQQVINQEWPEVNKAPSTRRDQSKAPPADQPSASEKVKRNVSVTRSPGKKEKKDETSIQEQEMNRLMEDQGATGSS